jgi:16S rRNA (cytosine967-C5)-methyltransferase
MAATIPRLRYHCVSVVAGRSACAAAQSLLGARMLSADAPRLPLGFAPPPVLPDTAPAEAPIADEGPLGRPLAQLLSTYILAEAPDGAVEELPGYEDGDWWVQDQAAALPARLLAAAPGEPVLDLCAAPGGKTLQLAATGASVTALDRSAPRLDRLRENLARTGLTAEIVIADGEAWAPPEKFAKILLDAPCSALGTLRRHPEGAWSKTEADVARFPAVQARLLASAARMLAPGGTLVYCVCSPLAAEGRDVVAAAIAEGLLVRQPVAPAECAGFEDCVTPEGDVVTLPSSSRDCDAFYIAKLTHPASPA